MPKECWIGIPEFPGYEVSDLGNVRSYRSPNGKGSLQTTPKLLRQGKPKGKPYFRVNLMQGNKRYHKKVHTLVLLAFKGERPSQEYDGCHDDGNAENNYLSNLYWGTKQENAQDRLRHGTQCQGEQVRLSKLTSEQATEILNHLPMWKRGDGRKFARKFGVSDSTISAIKSQHTWKHL